MKDYQSLTDQKKSSAQENLCQKIERVPYFHTLLKRNKQLEVKLAYFSSTPTIMKDFYQERVVSIALLGSYSHLILFLKKIHSTQFLISLDEFEITKLFSDKQDHTLEMKMTLKIYCI